MPTSETRTAMQIADLRTLLRRIKSNTYFDNFMNWYNTVRFHKSLDAKWYLQTPDIAFWSRLPEECKLGMLLNRMETELNG
jgi:hypothetical protein